MGSRPFDADIAERYGWVNRTLDDGDLDSFVDTLAGRLASFDREALAAAKAQVNRFGTPAAAELQSSNDLFFPLLALRNKSGAESDGLRTFLFALPRLARSIHGW